MSTMSNHCRQTSHRVLCVLPACGLLFLVSPAQAQSAAAGFGQRVGIGTSGSTALGSVAYGSRAAAPPPAQRAPAATAAAGSKAALGSRAAGSRATLGSQAATQVATAPVATQAVPGSRAYGTRTATGTQATQTSGAASTAAGAGSFATLVPPIEGGVPKLSSAKPGLLVVLGDYSGSMALGFAGDPNIKKADAVADVVNGTLEDWIRRNNQGGTIKNRLDVIMHGYGENTRNMLPNGQEVASLEDLAKNPLCTVEAPDPAGNLVKRPIWVTPAASGGTPMCAAFAGIANAVQRWQRRPHGEHLVLGVNVTDGMSTDGDPSEQVARLARIVKQQGGKLLMTNIHLSEAGSTANAVVFPTPAQARAFDPYGQKLFEMSSPVPAALAEKLKTQPDARMMAYNAGLDALATVFEAGSSAAAQ